jgi:predicted nucleotidyltransferase
MLMAPKMRKATWILLVEFSEPIGWRFFTLEKFLENEFGVPIDLVTKNALKD